MITLEKNNFIKFSEKCFLCYCQVWGSENYLYMIGVENDEWCDDYGLGIYGWGSNSEEAMIMGLKNIINCSLKSIPFSKLLCKETSFNEILEKIEQKDGRLDEVDEEYRIKADMSQVDESKLEMYGENPSFTITFYEGKCYPSMH